MNNDSQKICEDMDALARDASALMAATAEVAGDKVVEARKRLAAAVERGKEVAGRVRQKAAEGARVADKVVREHPYQAIAISFGVGAIVGCLIARRCGRSCS